MQIVSIFCIVLFWAYLIASNMNMFARKQETIKQGAGSNTA
jgi:hypothetical protein